MSVCLVLFYTHLERVRGRERIYNNFFFLPQDCKIAMRPGPSPTPLAAKTEVRLAWIEPAAIPAEVNPSVGKSAGVRITVPSGPRLKTKTNL